MNTIRVLIDWCPDTFGAVSEDIPGCVATDRTEQGVKEGYISALQFHLEGLEPDEIPECLKTEYKLEFEYSIPALLHHYDGIVTRAALSRVTGISQKLIGHYLTGYRTPRPARRQQIIDGLHRLGEELLAAH